MPILQRRKADTPEPTVAFVPPGLVEGFKGEVRGEVWKWRSTDGAGVVTTVILSIIDIALRYLKKTDDAEIQAQIGKLAWAAIVTAKTKGITFEAFGGMK